MFEIEERQLDSPGLTLRYYRAPWDEEIFGAPVVAISSIEVTDAADASTSFLVFRDWCLDKGVVLVSCRLPQANLCETGFLEARGFRYIELNFRPHLAGLAGRDFGQADGTWIEPALPADEPEIAEIAAQIFDTGRLHLDPLVGAEIGNRRYRGWVRNAFRNPAQSVFKYLQEGKVIGFFINESPAPHHRFWSLAGLSPGLRGKGLGRRLWAAMLRYHREKENVSEVSTSLSSHNTSLMNLYVTWGFRFPAPSTTLHWCPAGRIGERASRDQQGIAGQ